MYSTLPFKSRITALLCLFFGTLAFSQTATVFTDNFGTSTGATYTGAPGPIGNSAVWSLARSGTDFGAAIHNGLLILTDDASGAANQDGWALVSASPASIALPFSSTLNSNPGVVTWTFNMRQARNNPSGFGPTDFGSAFILAGTAGTTNVTGTGYAVILGNAGKTDPIRLVRYTAGIRNHTALVSSNSTGLTDFGKQYTSIKVTYAPSTNTWQLFVRNDGSSPMNPLSGTLTSQGTAVNSTYTSVSLPLLGGYWNGGNFSSQTAYFDNVNLTVAVPVTTAISPSSIVAGAAGFNLTVSGVNFTSSSTVLWNGVPRPTTFVSSTQLTAAISSADVVAQGTASVEVANGAAVSNAQTFTIDEPNIPLLTVSTNALGTQVTTTGTPSSSLSYTLTGENLSASAVVTAPSAFQVSTNNSTWTSSISLPVSGGQITGQPVTIYTRVAAATSAGLYAQAISNSSTGATLRNVAVSATVFAAQPTVQASAISFTSVTSTTFTVNWTSGNGGSRLVFIRSGSAVNAAPVDGETYLANPSFGNGAEAGVGNFTVYAGTGSSVTVSNLTPSTTYHIAVYEFNGSEGIENYLTSTPATANRLTLNAPNGWQIYASNTVNKINFDDTVDGVNTDSFQGAGISPGASSGELNSDAWAFAGFSDGALGFGQTNADNSDYDRGDSEGGVTDGGVYGFNTGDATANYSLGIQPAAGDFSPGSVTLRFQNQSPSTITSISLGYKVYVYNDQPGSSSLNFSHSANGNTFTSVSALDLSSPALPDAAPGWKAYYRVITITGISVTNNNYYYLRWTGAPLSGTSFDEFSIDDIVMVANPTTTFASFDGTAETFVVHGNTLLSGDVTVSSLLSINNNAKVDLSGKTLNIKGALANNTLSGLKGSATSNLILSGAVNNSLSFDQSVAGSTNLLNNLSVNTTAANTVTMLNPVVVNGTLATSAGQILNMGTNALTGSLAEISNNGTIATQNTTTLAIPSGKTWSGMGTVLYNAASAQQTIVTGTYQNLTSSSSAGAVAAGSFTVNGVLNLPTANPNATTGSLSMGTHTLTMGGAAANSGIGDVTGIITRNQITANTLYTFGHAHTSIVFPIAGTLPTSMSLKVIIGSAPSWRPNAILRQFDFIQTGGSNTKAVIKAHYLDSELNANNENKLVDWAYIISSNTTLEQGRSNFNTTENWVELTNVNVGLYFAPVFDQVKLTLDESEAGMLTWNGSVSTSWTTAANWTPNATPSDLTLVYIPSAATTPNDPMLNPTVLLGSLTIEPGGILNSPADAQFTINNGAGAWINNGTFNPGSGLSKVIFTNADATIAGSTQFNNLTINAGSVLRPVTGNVIDIAGAFVINGTFMPGVIENTVIYSGTNQTIAVPNGPIGAYHNLIINGTGAIMPASLNIRGDLTLNQPVNFAGTTINMVGSESQAIGGTSQPMFNDLVINNTFGEVDVLVNSGVSGTLTLAGGNLDIANNVLTLGPNAVAGTFDASRMIIASGTSQVRSAFAGAGSYLFPIGEKNQTAEYSPVTVSVSGSAFSNGYIGVNVQDAIHPNNSSDQNNISRYWNVSQTGITGAVATIAATYLANDITGTVSEISAAQLSGAFNQQTNGWQKYAPLSGTTLTAASAALGAQTSAFTGIKGAFSVLVSGYGEFCQNDSVTLTATPVDGNGPFTYLWTNSLGTSATATPPTSAIGTVAYSVTVRDNNGISATDTQLVTVLSPSNGGTVSTQVVCAGSTPSGLTLTGYNGQILYWQSSLDAAFTSPANISNITDVLTGAAIGPILETTYFRAVVKNGTCGEVFSTAGSVIVKSTTWNGAVWTNGAPDATTAVVFSGNYIASADLQACTILVNNNASVMIPAGFDVTVNGAVTVDSGTFTLESTANLLQLTDAVNSGNIVVKRNSSALMRLDYTLWSSPVSGQQLLAFSPLTTVSPTSRFYTYTTATNLYTSVTNPAATNFDTAKGYLIRMPNNHPTTATVWAGQFTGVPNNGNITYNMTVGAEGFRFNAVGNPYPSPIDAEAFVTDNAANITGALYFWRKTNNQLSPSYSTWTSGGGFIGNGEAQVEDLNGVIKTGQGFFVEASGNGSALAFNNAQRVGNNDDQFFRTSTLERHRIWLNASNDSGAFSQTLVGYIQGATLLADQNIDAKYINDGPIALTSPIQGVEHAIQGRPLPFAASDVVPLTFKSSSAGNFTIAIDHVDGLFAGQQVFLKDNFAGATHDLTTPYAFLTEAGEFTARFELVFEGALSTPDFDSGSIVAYASGGSVLVKSGDVIEEVQIFDLRGRLLANRSVNDFRVAIEGVLANQVLIVKVKTAGGKITTRKVMN